MMPPITLHPAILGFGFAVLDLAAPESRNCDYSVSQSAD
jgi:hypothetical protein